MAVEEMGWKEVHGRLVALAQERASLDYEEATLLIAAKHWRMHERLGYASMVEYVERTLGHHAKVARERMRVADALGDLPRMAAALKQGELSWSAARELTRVAIADTEDEWLATVKGMSLREIERRTSGYLPGDRPSQLAAQEAKRHELCLEISGATLALWEQARNRLTRESGIPLDDDQLIAQMARAVLGGPADEGRASFQIATIVCERCQQGWQQGAGERVAIDAAALAQARCDAQHVGDPSSATNGGKLPRALQDVTPAMRRQVMLRDEGRCVVVGCRQSVWVDVHHIDLRSDQGAHDADNLCVICDAHHRALHAGRLLIEGRPSTGLQFRHANGDPYGSPIAIAAAADAADAFQALRSLGFKEKESKSVLATIMPHVGHAAEFEVIMKKALAILSAGVARTT